MPRLTGLPLAAALSALPLAAGATDLTLFHTWSNESEMAALNAIIEPYKAETGNTITAASVPHETAGESPLISLFYLLGVGLLCIHLGHGFSSLLQTLGINSKKLMQPVSVGARVLAALVFIGYASIPIAVWSGGLKLPSNPAPAPMAHTVSR